MKRFYPDFESINAFTLSLDYHQDALKCAHCFKQDQFVSHGIIYKQRSSASRDKVGKRIFCSNRYGHSGCGRTFQLYLAQEIPAFHYNATHLFVFITLLLSHHSVKMAYCTATGQASFRHAWRWMNLLLKQVASFKSVFLYRPKSTTASFQNASLRSRILLPVLWQLHQHFSSNLCAGYQLMTQHAFL